MEYCALSIIRHHKHIVVIVFLYLCVRKISHDQWNPRLVVYLAHKKTPKIDNTYIRNPGATNDNL